MTINLNETPEAILTLAEDSVVTIDSVTMTFEMVLSTLEDRVYLTIHNPNKVEYPFYHVRDHDKHAVFTRQELVDLIESAQYTIS